MVKGWSVMLPNDQKPVFEDRCVGCQRPAPSALLSVQPDPMWGLAALGDLVLVNLTGSVRLPACRRCRHNFLWRRRGRRVGGVIVLVVLLLVARFIATRVGIGSALWPAIAAFFIVLVLGAALDEVWPPAVELTKYRHQTEYEFRNPNAAISFGIQNDASVQRPSPDPRSTRSPDG